MKELFKSLIESTKKFFGMFEPWVLMVGGVVLFGTFLLVAMPNGTSVTSQLFESKEKKAEVATQEPVVIAPPQALVRPAPIRTGLLRDVSTFDAAAIAVKDVESGIMLLEKEINTQRSAASITKLMTALTLIDIGMPWQAEGTVVRDDISGTHMYAGDIYSAEDLWLSMLVASSNKAAMTLVDMTTSSRPGFMIHMNELAASYGMTDSVFIEPTGLHAGNITTAKDILILLGEALEVPAVRDALRTQQHQIHSKERGVVHDMWNTNWLLLGWIPHQFYQVIGGKTGYIEAAKYNFTTRVVTVDGRILDVAVLGAPTHEARFTEARDALRAVLDVYEWGAQKSQ